MIFPPVLAFKICQAALQVEICYNMQNDHYEKYHGYPYEKAIIQGILMKKEPAQFKTIPLEELKKMTTIRGDGGFGSTGK